MILLGCLSYSFTPIAKEIGARLGLPVVDPLRAAIAVAYARLLDRPCSPSPRRTRSWTRRGSSTTWLHAWGEACRELPIPVFPVLAGLKPTDRL